MRSDESFLRRVVDPRDLPLIDTYVDALASAPEEIESESESESKSENDGGGCSAITSSLSCPNRSARLAEARELRGQSAAFHASVAQLEASVAARKQANLEAAVCGAVGLGAGCCRLPIRSRPGRRRRPPPPPPRPPTPTHRGG